MKKALKIIGIIFLVLLIIVGSLVIWQWDNIKSIYIGLTRTEEEIIQMRNENQEKLIKNIDAYLDEPTRQLTEEEKRQVESGELTIQDVYLKIFEERNKPSTQTENSGQTTQTSAENKAESSGGGNSSENSKTPGTSQSTVSNNTQSSKDAVVSKYMAQMYGLQSEFTAKAEATISQGKSHYEKLKKTQGKSTARSNTISHFTPIVRGIESECDSKVAAVISNMEKDLKKVGADTDIIRTIKATYENEKQLKLSYYTNKYLK